MVSTRQKFHGALFCDRDGVLIEAPVKDGKPFAIKSREEMTYCSDVIYHLSRLKGIVPIFMVTNQPEVERGSISKKEVEDINNLIKEQLELTEVYMCPHDDTNKCKCRKPSPGLLLQAASDYSIDLAQSFLVGDRWKDIECAQNVGMEAYFIDKNYEEQKPQQPYTTVESLEEVVEKLLLKVANND